MLKLVIRKMLNNKWMVLCLLIGCVLAVAVAGSIPMYTENALQDMIYNEMESFQEETEDDSLMAVYAGKYMVREQFGSRTKLSKDRYPELDKTLEEEYINELGLGILSQTVHGAANADIRKTYTKNATSQSCELHAMKGLYDNITLLYGRLPSGKIEDGTIEVIVSRTTEKVMDVFLDDELELEIDGGSYTNATKIKIVGVFQYKDNSNAFWYFSLSELDKAFFMDFDLFESELINADKNLVSKIDWNYSLDYTDITYGNIYTVLRTLNSQALEFSKESRFYDIPSIDILQEYSAKETEINILLLVLQVPILIILALYIFMVSQLIVEFDKNEISVLKSRGAQRKQIFNIYFIQGAVISLIALIIGPILAQFACSILGSANGFLSFSEFGFTATSIRLKTGIYCLAAVVFFMLTMLLPVLKASKTDIVALKRKKARGVKKPFWQKSFLDIILIGLSLAGLFWLGDRLDLSSGPVDPLLFILSSLFALGTALLFLRIYPFIIRIIFRIGRKKWGAVPYSAFSQVGRQKGKEQFLVVFIIFAITFGLFSASSARTIDTSMENFENYYSGAQYSIRPRWLNKMDGSITVGEISNDYSGQGFIEPDFEAYSKVDGLSNATKVFKRVRTADVDNRIRIKIGVKNETVNFIAIQADTFADTVSMPSETEKAITLKECCRILEEKERQWDETFTLDSSNNNIKNGVIISSSLADQYSLEAGDKITYSYGVMKMRELEIVAIVDYWPQYSGYEDNPKSQDDISGHLIVVSYDRLARYTDFQMWPYEIWYSRDDGVSSHAISQSFAENGLYTDWSKDVNSILEAKRLDAQYRGTHGALSLGFIVIILVCAVGFIIYWILSIKSRALQFGVLRAMGLTENSVIGILVLEQILLSGVAVIVGFALGIFTSQLFVPILQSAFTGSVPPQAVMMLTGDLAKVGICIGVMLIVGLGVIGWLIKKINITAAIKLGED